MGADVRLVVEPIADWPPATIDLPLHNRRGDVVGFALIDWLDLELSAVAWYRLANGYVVRTEGRGAARRMDYLHRRVLRLDHGDRRQGDHIDRDRLNCTRSNLRVATHAENGQNRGPNAGRELPRGVYRVRSSGRYRAIVKLDGVAYRLGNHATVEQADAAVRRFRAERMPFSPDAMASAS